MGRPPQEKAKSDTRVEAGDFTAAVLYPVVRCASSRYFLTQKAFAAPADRMEQEWPPSSNRAGLHTICHTPATSAAAESSGTQNGKRPAAASRKSGMVSIPRNLDALAAVAKHRSSSDAAPFTKVAFIGVNLTPAPTSEIAALLASLSPGLGETLMCQCDASFAAGDHRGPLIPGQPVCV